VWKPSTAAGPRAHRAAGEYRVSYRQVIAPAPEEWFIAASLSFERRPAAHESEVRALLERARRRSRSASGVCGSVFTNPREITPRASSSRRAQGLSHRRCLGVAQAREFHHHHGQASAATWSA